jgi:hypothetical protein
VVTDIQYYKGSLGYYSEDPDRFTLVFHTLALPFDLSLKDIQFFLTGCLIPKNKGSLHLPKYKQTRYLLTTLLETVSTKNKSQGRTSTYYQGILATQTSGTFPVRLQYSYPTYTKVY